MAKPRGKTFRFLVSATLGGSYVVVAGMNAFNKTSQAQSEDFETFDEAVATTIPGTPTERVQLSGFFIPGDAGQEIIRNARATGTTVFGKVLPEGGSTDAAVNAKGYIQEFSVGSQNHSAAPRGLQPHGWELTAVAAGTATVGGYVI